MNEIKIERLDRGTEIQPKVASPSTVPPRYKIDERTGRFAAGRALPRGTHPSPVCSTGMSRLDRSKGVSDAAEDLTDLLGEEDAEGWRAVFRKARCLVDDQDAPRPIREFWEAILEGRREDAIQILEQMEKE